MSLKDIIGEITSVKSTVSDTLGDKNRIMATIKLDKYSLVLTFFILLSMHAFSYDVVDTKLM